MERREVVGFPSADLSRQVGHNMGAAKQNKYEAPGKFPCVQDKGSTVPTDLPLINGKDQCWCPPFASGSQGIFLVNPSKTLIVHDREAQEEGGRRWWLGVGVDRGWLVTEWMSGHFRAFRGPGCCFETIVDRYWHSWDVLRYRNWIKQNVWKVPSMRHYLSWEWLILWRVWYFTPEGTTTTTTAISVCFIGF